MNRLRTGLAGLVLALSLGASSSAQEVVPYEHARTLATPQATVTSTFRHRAVTPPSAPVLPPVETTIRSVVPATNDTDVDVTNLGPATRYKICMIPYDNQCVTSTLQSGVTSHFSIIQLLISREHRLQIQL